MYEHGKSDGRYMNPPEAAVVVCVDWGSIRVSSRLRGRRARCRRWPVPAGVPVNSIPDASHAGIFGSVNDSPYGASLGESTRLLAEPLVR